MQCSQVPPHFALTCACGVFFNKQQTTPHYLREGPHNSAKVTEIIETSANKGEDGLKMMAELASQRAVLLDPKHNQWVSGVSEL